MNECFLKREIPIFYKTWYGRRVLVQVNLSNTAMSGMIINDCERQEIMKRNKKLKNKKLFTVFEGKEIQLSGG